MTSNLQKFEAELDKLINMGNMFLNDLRIQKTILQNPKNKINDTEKKFENFLKNNYQSWYTISISVIKQVITDRLDEFKSYYEIDPKRKVTNVLTYKIQDWVNERQSAKNDFSSIYYFDDIGVIFTSINTQLNILKAAKERLSSKLFDIKQLVQADIFDSEIDSARELLKKGFLRPAGIVAGVVLEKHLKQVCENHNLKLTKKNLNLSDLNEALKSNEVVDTPEWRKFSRLADIRNYCGHDKEREPTKDEVQVLIDETDKIVKTMF